MRALFRHFVPCFVLTMLAPVAGTAAGAADYQQTADLLDKAGKGDLAAVTAMLEAGIEVDAKHSHTRQTPLMAAASAGHLEVVHVLLKAGAKVNARDAQNWTALFGAVLTGRTEVVRALLAAGADPDICAPTYGQCRGPLSAALSTGNIEMARALLEGGASVHSATSYGATPLRFAVWGDTPQHVAIVKALLARGADADAGHASSFRAPANPGPRRNAEGTALGDVAAKGSVEMVKALLEGGAKVDARQPGWKTPLMLAAAAGNVAVARVLLDAGADVNAKDSDDRTALDAAQTNKRLEMANMLREASARSSSRR